MQNPEELLHAAEQVTRILDDHHVPAVVIGAVALAAYHYVRLTQDIDLGVNTDLGTLRKISSSLNLAGFKSELSEPDGDDPLGGVIDVLGPFGLLQIVNFGGRFPAVIEDSLRAETIPLRPGSPLKLVPLPQLVALKLYAGGLKSKSDLVELLTRNPGADMDKIRDACDRYRLVGLDDILREL